MRIKNVFLFLGGAFFLGSCLWVSVIHAAPNQKTDKEREALVGPVKTVFVEIGKISKDDSGEWIPGARMPWLSTTYDIKGNQVEEDQLYNEESLDFKSVFEHDSEGRLKGGLEYDYKGVVAFKWTYMHDDAAMKVTEKRVFPNEVLFSTSVYQYDARGNLIEEIRSHTEAANSFKWVYTHDDAGRLIEEAFYLIRSKPLLNQRAKSLNYKSVYSYGKGAFPTRKIHYGPSGTVESDKRFRYEYDAEGNWITQTAWESPTRDGAPELEPTEVTFRTITYYP